MIYRDDEGRTLEYNIVRRRRMKNIRMRMKDGRLVVSAPYGVPNSYITEVIRRNADHFIAADQRMENSQNAWEEFVRERTEAAGEKPGITKSGDIVIGRPFEEESMFNGLPLITTAEEFQDMFDEAYYEFCIKYSAEVTRVTMRKMKSRWGSCRPDNGRLTFNLLLLYVPQNCARYVIYHELCHFLEANHSKRFWAHVEEYVPDRRDMEKTLRAYGAVLIDHMMPRDFLQTHEYE